MSNQLRSSSRLPWTLIGNGVEDPEEENEEEAEEEEDAAADEDNNATSGSGSGPEDADITSMYRNPIRVNEWPS